MRPSLPRLVISTLAILAWCNIERGGATPTPQSSDSGQSMQHCVDDRAWSRDILDLAPDCEKAIETLRDESDRYLKLQGYFRFYPDHSYVEFPTLGSSTALPKIFEHGLCVVAVVMMHAFTNKPRSIQFPDLTDPFMPGRWSTSDTAVYGSLVSEADAVRATCTNGMGYSLTGDLKSIGVAVMARGSRWETFIRTRIPPQPVGNATSMEYPSDSGTATS